MSCSGGFAAESQHNLRPRPLRNWRDYRRRCVGSICCCECRVAPDETLGNMSEPKITINRAPVLTLWAAVVAERLGFDRDEALSFGKAVAGLTAQSKGRRLGIYKPVPLEIKKARTHKHGEEFFVEICGR